MERAVIVLNVLSFIATAALTPFVLASGIVIRLGLMFAKPNLPVLVAAVMYAPMILPCLCLMLSLWAKRRRSKIAPLIAGLPLALFIAAQFNPSTSYF